MVGIDQNCLSCAYTENNEATLKAFKMACLTYNPSKVRFEQTKYTRVQLINAKEKLMKYCLNELKHLDLGNIE